MIAARELAQRESHGFLEPVRDGMHSICRGPKYSERSGRERLFGLENGKGEKDAAEITWADVPDAWKYAVREGRLSSGAVALAIRPEQAAEELIEPFMESGLMRDMMAGYRQNQFPRRRCCRPAARRPVR